MVLDYAQRFTNVACYMVRLKDNKKHDFLGIWSYTKFVCEVVKSGKSNTRMTLLLNHKFNANTGII